VLTSQASLGSGCPSVTCAGQSSLSSGASTNSSRKAELDWARSDCSQALVQRGQYSTILSHVQASKAAMWLRRKPNSTGTISSVQAGISMPRSAKGFTSAFYTREISPPLDALYAVEEHETEVRADLPPPGDCEIQRHGERSPAPASRHLRQS
jgi:hypothetical protein